jgi:3-hydroxyisobutyrate dehydrogenase
MRKVAFLGLGLMGAPMARNLIKAGFDVTVYNRTKEKSQPFAESGVKVAESPADAALDADVVISIVSDPAAVNEVLLGKYGVITTVKKGAVVIDMSTVDPQTVRDAATAFHKKGVSFLDSPVTGGVKGATEGTLILMVGGEKETLEKVRSILESMSSKIFHMGEVGKGMATKLVLNSLTAAGVYMYAELLMLAEAQGLDREQIVEFLNATPATSEGMRSKSQNFVSETFEASFYTSLMTKDIRLALHEAEKFNVPMPVLAEVAQMYSAALWHGFGLEDMSSVIKVLEKKKGS